MTAPLPGGVAVSLLHVYDTVTPDGLVGGSAHVHLTCTEGYVVLDGEGAVQTLGPDGFAETPLRRGSVVWFTPGIIHRLVNRDRRLEILALMQNAGLPEAGDAVLTFPDDVLSDEERYRAAASVGDGSVTDPGVLGTAQRRRDLAIDGFARLRQRVEESGPEALREFYTRAQRLVAGRVPDWRRRWQEHSLRAAELTGEQLDRIEKGDVSYLLQASVHAFGEPTGTGRPGMCGALDTYDVGTPPNSPSARGRSGTGPDMSSE